MAAVKADGGAADNVDIYEDHNAEEVDSMEMEADALYDDVLTGSVDVESTLGKQENKEDNKPEVEPGKRFSVYIGIFNWWTSDIDLIKVAQKQGVKDIIEVKFAENRTNGQSKGYAKMVVSTEESFQRLLMTLPQCKINGEKVECRFVSRRNLADFEAEARKRMPLRLNNKGDLERADRRNSSTPSPSDHKPLPLPLMLPSTKPPPLMPSYFNTPPPPPPPPPVPPLPLFTHPPPMFPPPSPLTHFTSTHPPNSHVPSLHINPAFLPPGPAIHSNNIRGSACRAATQLGEAEFEELINRNRMIASSAITKAVSAATSGDIRMAIETLYTATAVIKQSHVFYDKRCGMLVESLNNCLNSIETKCFPTRKRHRSRERSRSQSRSRSRDRYGEHSSSTDRERERDRERGRDREHRVKH